MDPFFSKEGKVTRALYRNVSNTAEVRKDIFMKRLPICLLKPKLIVDELQLSVAVSKALNNQMVYTMTTKSFATEVIYCLSPSKNISESIKTFGTEEGDTDVLVLGEGDILSTNSIQFNGDAIPLTSLNQFTDTLAVTELYQITPEELTISTLLDSVITKMATKDYQL